jgi:hypothetical protein
MADNAGPAAEPGLEARVAHLETDVAHIRGDIAEIKTTLNRLAPLIDEFRGFIAATLPALATKTALTELNSDIAEMRAEFKSDVAELRAEFKSDIASCAPSLSRTLPGSAPNCSWRSRGGRRVANPYSICSRSSGWSAPCWR